MMTIAETEGSCSARSRAAEIPSGTPVPSAFTGGLSIVITATPSLFIVSWISSFMHQSKDRKCRVSRCLVVSPFTALHKSREWECSYISNLQSPIVRYPYKDARYPQQLLW